MKRVAREPKELPPTVSKRLASGFSAALPLTERFPIVINTDERESHGAERAFQGTRVAVHAETTFLKGRRGNDGNGGLYDVSRQFHGTIFVLLKLIRYVQVILLPYLFYFLRIPILLSSLFLSPFRILRSLISLCSKPTPLRHFLEHSIISR